jgi:ribosomal protein L37AE/L43A
MYCNICKKTYTSYQSHWIHMKKFHPVENKHKENHICNLCDKQFTSRQSKWRHTLQI